MLARVCASRRAQVLGVPHVLQLHWLEGLRVHLMIMFTSGAVTSVRLRELYGLTDVISAELKELFISPNGRQQV